MSDVSKERYPLVEAFGSPYELGIQHGRAVPERIRRFIDMILESETSAERSKDIILQWALRGVPLLEKYCPNLLEEIRGLKDGAKIHFEEAVLLQLRGGAANYSEEACTTFAISGAGTCDRRMFIGQNSDMGPQQEEVGILLHLIPSKGPRILMWTFAGNLGYHGMNSEGVAHFANSLGGGPKGRFGLSHYPLKRAILEQVSLQSVFQLLDRYPVASNGNYTMCDGTGAYYNVELTSEGYGRQGPGDGGFIAHSNHYLCSPWACPENHANSIADSFPRLDRMRTLIDEKYGRVTLANVQAFLSDHSNAPTSICRHLPSPSGGNSKTVCAMIAEPTAGMFHVCKGNPCAGSWKSYQV